MRGGVRTNDFAIENDWGEILMVGEVDIMKILAHQHRSKQERSDKFYRGLHGPKDMQA